MDFGQIDFPRPPYNYTVAVGSAYEPGVDPDPEEPTAEETAQDRVWQSRVEALAGKHAKALKEYNQSQRQKEKHNKAHPPPKALPGVTMPAEPDRPAPRPPRVATPKPSPPPSPLPSPKTGATPVTLWQFHVTIENGYLQWIYPVKMVMFHSYVSLRVP